MATDAGHADQHRSANQRQALPCFFKLADGRRQTDAADTLQPAKEQKLGNGQAEDEGHPDHIQQPPGTDAAHRVGWQENHGPH